MRILISIALLASTALCAFGQQEVVDASTVAASSRATHAGNTSKPYVPITAEGRLIWVVKGTLGPASLMAGLFTSGRQTWTNSPPEDGTHWDGFAKRYGIRLTSRATSNLMEAEIGSLWDEDPRYFRAAGRPMNQRLVNVVRSVFTAHDLEGHEVPAYARYIAIPSSSFLTNAWRPDSQRHLDDAFGRMETSLVNRVIGNAFSEFFPDIKNHLKRNKGSSNHI